MQKMAKVPPEATQATIEEMRTGFADLRGELRTSNTLLMEEKAGRRVTNSLVIGSALAIAAFALGAAWLFF